MPDLAAAAREDSSDKVVRSLVAPVLLLAIFAALAISSMSGKSVTGDEVSHLPAGYSYLATGDFRLNPQHPPLMKMLAAIPLFGLDLLEPEEIPGWQEAEEWEFGTYFLTRNREELGRLVFLARLPMVAVGVLLGALLFAWSRRLLGLGPALGVLLLYAFSPNLLAHTAIVHTDVGVAAFSLLALFALWTFSRVGARRWLVVCGLALGLALLAKYSAVITVIAILLLLPAVFWLSWPRPNRSPKELLAAFALVLTPALVVVAIGFDAPLGWGRYIDGFLRIHADANPDWQAFLWGEHSPDGFRSYYLLAQLWKMPLPALLLSLAGLIGITVRNRREALDWAFILIPILGFHGAAFLRPASIGVRHVLPAFPFFLLAAGFTMRRLVRRRATFAIVIGLLVWQVVGTLRAYPDYIPYFNELAGGTAGGVHYLDDSNLEWGQDLALLAEWIHEEQPGPIALLAFEPLAAETYGIEHRALTLEDVVRPVPGVTYAIGASALQDRSVDPDHAGIRLDWLDRFEPRHRLGGSIYIYRFSLSPEEAEKEDAQALDRETWFGVAVARLGDILLRQPDHEEARSLLASSLLGRASWYRESARTEEAERDLAWATQLMRAKSPEAGSGKALGLPPTPGGTGSSSTDEAPEDQQP